MTTISLVASFATAQIEFPKDAGLINVRDHGVKGDGVTDNTAALQKVFADFNGSGAVIYLPAGTYVISDTIKWQGRFTNTILQGQGQDHTIIRLKDAAPDFDDTNKPKPIFFTGGPPAQRFRNGVRDLTIDSGSQNPGAVGLNFCANNQGIVRDVTIRSGVDGKQPGAVGLALDQGEVGPLMVKNLRVIGFEIGVRVRHSVNSVTLEDIELTGQRSAGIDNHNNLVFVRKLHSTNAVPAIVNDGADGVFLLIDSKLDGTESKPAAIENRHERSQLFVRNIETGGYENAIRTATGTTVAIGEVEEWVSQAPLMVFPSVARTLNLPVVETPDVPRGDVSKWVNVQAFGANPTDAIDDTAAIQKAIDSGAETIYFPRGVMLPPPQRGANPGWRGAYFINETIYIRGNVKRMIGFEAMFYFSPKEGSPEDMPVFVFEDGPQPTVVIERLMFQIGNAFPNPAFVHNAKRDLVLASFTGARSLIHKGTGKLFIEDVVGTQPWKMGPGSQLYARQLNIEGELTEAPKLTNTGGTAWVLGFKTEHRAPVLGTYDGGVTEILGAHFYTCVRDSNDKIMLDVRDAKMTVAGGGEYVWTPDWATETLLRETRNGETRTLNKTALIRRGGGSMLSLVSTVPTAEQGRTPRSPKVQIIKQTAASVELSLQPESTEDDVAGFRIERDGKLVGLRRDSFVETGITPGSKLVYKVSAYNRYGTASEPTSITVETQADTTAPTKPAELTAADVTHRRVLLRWKPSEDELGIKQYVIERSKAGASEAASTQTASKPEWNDDTVERGSSYVSRVTAIDQSGNRSDTAEVKVDVPAVAPAEATVELESPAKKHKLLKVKGWQIGNLSEGLWATYDEIDFERPKPFNRAALRYGLPESRAGVAIDLFLDATIEGYEERPGKNRSDVTDGEIKGKLLGTFVLQSTGGFDKKSEVTIPIEAPTSGLHTITLRVRRGDSAEKNALGDLDKIRLFNDPTDPK